MPPALLLVTLCLLAVMLRVGAATRQTSVHHPDEVFQTREPAHRLAFGHGVVTWEFREGVRSWVFPGFLAGVMRATEWMGAGSDGYLLGIAIVLSLISLTTVVFAFMWGHRAGGATAAVVAAGACAIWYELVYFGPRALNEILAAHVLLPGLYLGAYAPSLHGRNQLLVAGVFCGLAVALRPLLGPAVVFAVAYVCWQDWRRRLPPLAAGLLLPVIAFGLVDALTWSYPFQSFVRYFWANVVEGRSLAYGAFPWYVYALGLSWQLGPMLLLAVWGSRGRPLLGGVALLILLTHSILPHKEYRFIYPILPLVVTLAGIGAADLASRLGTRPALSQLRGAAPVGALLAIALISAGLARRPVSFTPFGHDSGTLIAFRQLSREPDVCGVAIDGTHWSFSGGYTYLHRKVSIVLLLREGDLGRLRPTFNYLVTNSPALSVHPGFSRLSCASGTCVHRRLGPCEPALENEINHVLGQER